MIQSIRNTTVEVLYTCNQCGIDNGSVQVSERQNNEKPIDFVNKAAGVAAADHSLRSPHCRATSFTTLYVPCTEDGLGVKDE